MSKTISFPIITIDGKKWIRVDFTKSIVLRAAGIDKRKKRVQEPSGHRFDEALAEGSIKFTSRKAWDLSQLSK